MRRIPDISKPIDGATLGERIAIGFCKFVIGLAIILLLMVVLVRIAKAHDSWISRGGLKNLAGEWCCGAEDCKELNYTPTPINGGVQLSNGEVIPQSEIMPISPEGYVICRRPDGSRRCVFAPPSGS